MLRPQVCYVFYASIYITNIYISPYTHTQKDFEGARLEYETALLSDPHNQILKDNLSKLERAAATRKGVVSDASAGASSKRSRGVTGGGG